MKDEEMAEEYKEKHICSTCADIQDCGNDCPFSRCGVQAFLAGLKAGRPQWHKVADGDLPDNIRYVWTNAGVGYHDEDGWWDEYGRLNGVIAWCEPKFEEETEDES